MCTERGSIGSGRGGGSLGESEGGTSCSAVHEGQDERLRMARLSWFGLDLLQGDYVISWLHVCDALADRLHDACAFMAEDDGKRALWVFA